MNARPRWIQVLLGVLVAFGILVMGMVSWRFVRVDNLNDAIRAGDLPEIERALRSGVDVNGRGMHSRTPLMSAAGSGRIAVCTLLIQRGADINGHNDSASVLMMAVDSGNEQLVRYLLALGVNRSWTNAIGVTAQSLARQRQLKTIETLLTE